MKGSNRHRFVQQMLDAADASFTMSNEEYIDALEEVIEELEARLMAAKESA